MIRTAFLTLIPLMAAPAVIAGEMSHHAEWSAWIEEGDANYATDRMAILKASDVVYLKSGETVWLSLGEEGAADLAMTKPAAPLLSVSYDGTVAQMHRNGLTFDLTDHFADAGRYPISERIDLGGGLSEIAPGEKGMRVIVFDQESEAAKNFAGLEWFDYDPAYRFKTKFVAAEEMKPETIQTERGLFKQYFLVGHAKVKMDGQKIDFPLYAPSNDPAKITYLFTSFTDETSGEETYGVGRYMDADGFESFPPKKVTLDFNRAYNPYCARSPHYNCPVAMTHLGVAVRVGEKAPADRDH